MKDNEMAPSASPVALTDESIARAIEAWFKDFGIEGNFELRMRNALLAAQPAEPARDPQTAATSQNAKSRLAEPATAALLVLPERVIDVLMQTAGVDTFHPDGDQLGKLHAFAHGVTAEVLARLPAEPALADRQGVALSVTGDEVRAIVKSAHPGGSDHPSGADYVMATIAYLNRRVSSSRGVALSDELDRLMHDFLGAYVHEDDAATATATLRAILSRASSSQGVALSKDTIREVFMAHGFTVKEGQTDLKPYVYGAAYALLSRASSSRAEVERNGDRLRHLIENIAFVDRMDLGHRSIYRLHYTVDSSSQCDWHDTPEAAIDAAMLAAAEAPNGEKRDA